jgi:hypothetical protein
LPQTLRRILEVLTSTTTAHDTSKVVMANPTAAAACPQVHEAPAKLTGAGSRQLVHSRTITP